MSKGVDKEMLARDLIEVLKSNVDEQMKKICANYVIYTWTEYDGKYEDNPYWSLKALEYHKISKRQGKLVHEHIIPRNIIIKELLGLGKKGVCFDPNDDVKNTEVYQMLKNNCIAAIITRDEDKVLNETRSNSKSLKSLMPQEYYQEDNAKYYHNPWSRYIKANDENEKKNDLNKIITIFDLNKQGEVIITKDNIDVLSIIKELEKIKLKNPTVLIDDLILTVSIALKMDENNTI